MKYVRPVDLEGFPAGKFHGEFLWATEACFAILTHVPPRHSAPPRHVHSSDQIYFTLRGTMHLMLGEEQFVAPPRTAVFIPAGVPHNNWNPNDDDGYHLEFFAPGIHPMLPLMTPVEDTDAKGLPYALRTVDPEAYGDPARMPTGLGSGATTAAPARRTAA